MDSDDRAGGPGSEDRRIIDTKTEEGIYTGVRWARNSLPITLLSTSLDTPGSREVH